MKQVPGIPRENIIIEPVGKNAAPCIGLAAPHVKKRDPEGIMVVLPADHLIFDARRFRHLLSIACEVAESRSHIVTIGIRPTAPDKRYGYLRTRIT